MQAKQRRDSSGASARIIELKRLSRTDIIYVIALTIASLVTYLITYYVLEPFVKHPNDSLGAMVATISTMFVFKKIRAQTFPAAITRFFATGISCVLTLIYLLLLPSSPIGMAVIIGIGTFIVLLLGQLDEVIPTGITTIVIMVTASIGPANQGWTVPPLRLLDTVIGIIVGVSCAWIGRRLYQE